jgi:hypothetical protein
MESEMEKQKIFSWYNKAKRAARQGKLDPERVNLALGLLQTKDRSWRDKYHPTTESCGCPDHQFRGHTCKHMIARMIEYRAENTTQQSSIPLPGYESGDGEWVTALQESPSRWRVYVFSNANIARRYIAEHPGHWIAPSAARGRRNHPDVIY